MPSVVDKKTGEELMSIAYDDKGYWKVLARKVMDIMGPENVEIVIEPDYARPEFGRVPEKKSEEAEDQPSEAKSKKAKSKEPSDSEASGESDSVGTELGARSSAPSSSKSPDELPELRNKKTEAAATGPAVLDGKWKRPLDY